MYRVIMMLARGNGSDLLLHGGLSSNELRGAEDNLFADMHELKYLIADVECEWKALPAYVPIYIIYLHVVHNGLYIYKTDYLGYKPILAWRLTYDNKFK